MDEQKIKVRDRLIPDCFGNTPSGKHCCILVEDVCLYGDCTFYKTREQFEADRIKYSKGSGVSPRVFSGKKIMCVETKKVYLSIRSAAEDLGVSGNSVSLVLRGKQKNVCGLTFKYV